MSYTYSLTPLGRAAILQFVQDHGVPELNPEAYFATAEVEADNFNQDSSQRAELLIPENSSKDGLCHRLFLEQHWFHREYLPPPTEQDALFL
ncbi:hypothetical protein [Alcaligenes endophyticus]|uniref:Uncharacterized protein n=1 Tax=Alcaligenes endophyticus TaxID=1929088 RepID=A0ABT8EIP6_9BURK|nr:hypothetical protein [Alcaligenes endophyticus]MCX5592441.1 hypothetical protein [Alcaligenes endophyticus]MDN4121166.1 hypothetical protein [Alcaligenes endophyticus]